MLRVIYPFEKIMKGEGNPNLKELENVSPKESMDYLMQPNNMKGKYLGACLDSCRWGSMTTVAWKTDIKGLMDLIQKWREENDDKNLYHEMPIEKFYKKFELPYINHDKCPRDKNHNNTFLDGGGRLRCGHRTVEKYKPSFLREYEAGFDELSQMKIKEFYEKTPIDSSYENDEGEWIYPEPEFSNYLRYLEKFESEEPTEEVIDVCYSIISDKNLVLPFETILERLNLAPITKTVYCGNSYFNKCQRLKELDKNNKKIYELTRNCPGHEEMNKFTEFPFDGWDLAYYLLRWEQQNKNPPWFARKHEKWTKRY